MLISPIRLSHSRRIQHLIDISISLYRAKESRDKNGTPCILKKTIHSVNLNTIRLIRFSYTAIFVQPEPRYVFEDRKYEIPNRSVHKVTHT